MEIIKKYTKKYKVTDILERPFMNYGKFKGIRIDLGKNYEKVCFNCHKRFRDTDDAYLVSLTEIGNRLICKECHKNISATLNKERNGHKEEKNESR